MPATKTLQVLSNASLQDFPTDRERTEAIKACQSLLTKLRNPFERVWEAVVDYPALVASLKFCLDIDLFRVWKAAGNDDRSGCDLARMVSYDRVDILGKPHTQPQGRSLDFTDRSGSMLKHLAAHAVIEEIGDEIYRPTKFSNAMLTSTKAGIEY